VYRLSSETDVVAAFAGVRDAGDGSSSSAAVFDDVGPTNKISGVKRSLAQAFVEVDSDDEPLAKKYGKFKDA